MNSIRQDAGVTGVTGGRRSPGWAAPAGLVLLSVVPVLAGASRLTELASGAVVTEHNARFFAEPVPVVVHILAVTVYSLLGAFQFAGRLRAGHGRWHRAAGRLLIPAGLLAAVSGLWMALFYALPPSDGQLLLIFRLTFGIAMTGFILAGSRALVNGNFAAHGAWMTRAYAIGLGAGTQALILIVPELLATPPGVTARALLMGFGWMINLAVAEYVISRRTSKRFARGGGSAR